MVCVLFFFCALSTAGDLEIYCIEVGLDVSGFYQQGDSTLVISPNGTRLLIDGGYGGDSGSNSVLALFGRVIPTGGLDYMITTHWDDDHSGGLDNIATYNSEQYMPTTIYDLGDSATEAESGYNTAFSGKQETPDIGDVLDLGGGCTATFVSIDGNTWGGGYTDPDTDANARSIGVLIQYGGFDYLSLGDLPDDWENDLGPVIEASGVNIDVLHVSHHGSYNSTDNEFVASILPEYAVISCGDNNGHGHPHQNVINHLNAKTDGGAAYSPPYEAVTTIYTLERGDDDAGTADNVTIVGDGHDTDPTLQGSLKITVSSSGYQYSFENEGPNTNEIDDGPYDTDDSLTPDFYGYARWPMFGYNADRTGSTVAGGPAAYSLKWTFNLGEDVSSSPAVGVGDDVYIGSDSNVIYCLVSDGSLRWTYSTAGNIASSMAIGSSTVFIGSDDNRLYALSSQGGSLLWTYVTGGDVSSSPAFTASNEEVYVGSDDNRVYALNAAGGLLWSYQTGGDVESSPAASVHTAYVGSNDNRVFALWHDGSLHWSYETAGDVTASPALGATNTVYVGSKDNRFYAVDCVGKLQWSYRFGDSILSSSAVDEIYVGSNDNKVYALDYDGALLWSYATAGNVSSSPAVDSSGKVFVGSEDTVLYGLVSTGALFWSYRTTEPITSSVAIGSGTVYIGSDNNNLYAF
jgi:outer membrane protein assembly factor BamB/beta-lactamase superfamily II metal-dependent hydrolase